MRTLALIALLVFFLLFVPATASAQYIGNPTGKTVPFGVEKNMFDKEAGFLEFDLGFSSQELDAEYEVTDGEGGTTLLDETSRLNQGSFVVAGGGHLNGFEIEGKLGFIGQKLEEDRLDKDPLDDAYGILLGTSARWGFSPVRHLRLGLGGQLAFTWSQGDAYVSDSEGLWKEDVELSLFTGQLFTGASLDFQLSNSVVISPYLGAGLEFVAGELEYDTWDCCCCVYERDLADFDEEDIGMVFGGFDLHLSRQYRVSVEARGKESSGAVVVSMGFRF